MPPKISVVIPVYNGEKHLKETLESILSQTYADFEVLTVDDGSTDGSLKILEDYARVDGRIKFFSNNENKGIAFTTYFGIEQASGEFIALTDQDDISFPERFDKQLAFLEIHPEIDVLGAQIICMDSELSKIRYISCDPLTSGAIRWGMIFGCPIANPVVIFRKRVFTELGIRFGNFKYSQDYDLFVRLCQVVNTANLSEPLLYHREHESNTSKTGFVKQRQETYDIVRYQVRNLIGENLPDDIISGILYARHMKKKREIDNIKEACEISRVLFRLENKAIRWDLSKADRQYIKQNTASRLRHIWIKQKYHPFLLPYVFYSIVLDPDLFRRKIGQLDSIIENAFSHFTKRKRLGH